MYDYSDNLGLVDSDPTYCKGYDSSCSLCCSTTPCYAIEGIVCKSYFFINLIYLAAISETLLTCNVYWGASDRNVIISVYDFEGKLLFPPFFN